MYPYLFSVCFLLIATVKAQEKYPQDAFQSPLNIPLILSGTFGELRSSHFHAGIDIKTQQREGLPVFAIAEGTVSRIKISHWGYGKTLYVKHPNGYTSVYAHLQKYNPEIEAYIKKAQYQKQSYEIELFPRSGTLNVTQGSVLGYSGNTGSSSGPHLHFEIRQTDTQKPTNPLLYGYDVSDTTPPTIEAIFAYPLSNDAVVNQSAKKIQLHFVKQPDGTLLANKITAAGTLGFGFVGFDRQDMAANRNGVYTVQQKVNGKVYADYTFDALSFKESRYLNTLVDYAHLDRFGQRIQKCFKEPYNRLKLYETLYNDGKIEINPGFYYMVELRIADIAGNTTRVLIPIEGKRETPKIQKDATKSDKFIAAHKPYYFNLGTAKVYFPINTFYQDFYINLKKEMDTLILHNSSVATHRDFLLSFNTASYTPTEKQQLFIAHLRKGKTPKYIPTYKRGDSLMARTRALGRYTLAKDTVPPIVRPKNFKEKGWLSRYRYLQVEISDDLSGVDTYRATLNGKWILMEYDPKRNTLTYDFEDKITNKTQCQLSVTVTDKVGNTTTLKNTFFRK